MIYWAAGVTTADRPGANYLQETLASIAEGGWEDIVVFEDPKHDGPWRNFKRAVDALIQNVAPEDWVVMFQDDVCVTPGVRHHIEKSREIVRKIDEGNFVSLYTAGPHHSPEGGWHPIAEDDLPRKCYGALGVIASAITFADLVDSDLGRHVRNRTDFWIGKFCQQDNREYLQHSPSFIKHTGEVSSLEQRNEVDAGDSEIVRQHNAYYRQCAEWCDDVRKVQVKEILRS